MKRYRIRQTNAYILFDSSKVYFSSYSTNIVVVSRCHDCDYIYIDSEYYSRTTTRHKNEFLRILAEYYNKEYTELKKFVEHYEAVGKYTVLKAVKTSYGWTLSNVNKE